MSLYPKLPKAFVEAAATVSEKKQKIEAAALKKEVTARIDMSDAVAGAGRCPECKKPMIRTNANGIPVMSCDEHRIAIPIKDGM